MIILRTYVASKLDFFSGEADHVWHLSTLNDICQPFSHLVNVSKSFYMFWQSTGLSILRNRKQSSANKLVVDEIHKGKSLM